MTTKYVEEPMAAGAAPAWAKQMNERAVRCRTCTCVYTQRYWAWTARGEKVVGGIPESCTVCAERATREAAEVELAKRLATVRAAGEPMEWVFDSTANAYDQSQCDVRIAMGDILVVEAEQVVGFLLAAWPVAVTMAKGDFHGFALGGEPAVGPSERDPRDWRPYYEAARRAAISRGFPLSHP